MAIELTRQGGFVKYKDTTSGFFKVLNLNTVKIRIDHLNPNVTVWSDGSRYDYSIFDTPTFASAQELVNQVGEWKEEAAGSIDSLNNFVFVSTLLDLPAAVGGVITLAAETTYFFLNDLDLNGRGL